VAILFFSIFVSGELAAAKIEQIKLDSFDIKSARPATSGDWKNKPLKVKATWNFPSSGEGPFPMVIYLLGGGGYKSSYHGEWIKWFNKQGIASLLVDQYSARGMSFSTGLGSKQAGMTDPAYLSDVYAAIRVATADPRINSKQIFTFGSSWGGGIQMYLMSKWYKAQLGDDVADIAGHIALGPACYVTVDKPAPTKGKMLMLLGGKDKWNQPAPCMDYGKRLSDAGADISVEMVKDAGHRWDGNLPLRTVRVTVYHCDIRFNPVNMKAHELHYGVKVNLNEKGAWGKLFKKCTKKKRKVTVNGTKAQLDWTRDRVSRFLTDELDF